MLALLLLSACQPTMGPGPAAPIAGRSPTPQQFATQIAGPGTYLGPMPTAIALLKPEDMARNRAFCTAFARLPTVQEELARSVVAPNLIYTRWLTQLGEVAPDKVRDCDFLAGTYDYARSKAIIASVTGATVPLTGRGPYLLLLVPESTGTRVVGVDGSNYSEADFDRFVASWNQAIGQAQTQITSRQTEQPGIVRSLFGLLGAILRGVFGATAAVVEGTLAAL